MNNRLMRLSLRTKVVLGAIQLTCVLGSVGQRANAQEVSIADVRKAWLARQAKVDTATFQFTQERTIAKGSYNGVLEDRPGEDIPPKDLTTQSDDHWLLLSGKEKVCYKTDIPDLTLEQLALGPRRAVYAFNGKTNRSLSSAREVPYAEGIVSSGDGFNDRSNLNIAAILFAYRALHRDGLVAKLKAYRIEIGHYVVNGTRCVLLRENTQDPNTGMRLSLWLDPAKDLVLVRYAEHYDDRPGKPPRLWAQLTVSYTDDAEYGPVPSTWSVDFMQEDGESLRTSVRAKVVEYTFNRPIASEEFDLPFPTGTYVVDNIQSTEWIQLEGERQRVVTREETLREGVTYEELLATESGMAGLNRGNGGWVLWSAAAIACLVVVGVLLRWVLKRKETGA